MSIMLGEANGFTPVIDVVANELGLVPAAVYGVAWRYCQERKGVCFASLATMAKQLGLNPATVQRHLQKLCDAGYLEDTTPALRNKPHTYRDTGRVEIVALVEARIAERKAEESHVAESNVTLHTATSHCREYVEDTMKILEETLPAGAEEVAEPPVKKARKRSAKQQAEDAASKTFEDDFVRATGIPAPDGAARNSSQTRVRWWVPLRNMLKQCNGDTDVALAVLHSVIADMRQRNLPVSAPQSAEKMFTAACGLRNLQQTAVASSGGKPWYADGGSMRLPVQTSHGRGNDG